MRISDWSSDVCSSDLVYLAGGPGGSGISAAEGPRFELFMALREVADVIALDQRGTGASAVDPDCQPPLTAFERQVLTRDTFEAYLDQAASYCNTWWRSEEHTSELQSLMRISYAVFCLKKKNTKKT